MRLKDKLKQIRKIIALFVSAFWGTAFFNIPALIGVICFVESLVMINNI